MASSERIGIHRPKQLATLLISWRTWTRRRRSAISKPRPCSRYPRTQKGWKTSMTKRKLTTRTCNRKRGITRQQPVHLRIRRVCIHKLALSRHSGCVRVSDTPIKLTSKRKTLPSSLRSLVQHRSSCHSSRKNTQICNGLLRCKSSRWRKTPTSINTFPISMIWESRSRTISTILAITSIPSLT